MERRTKQRREPLASGLGSGRKGKTGGKRVPPQGEATYRSGKNLARLIQEILSSPRGVGFERLGERLAVSDRTLYRYVKAVREELTDELGRPLLEIVSHGERKLIRLADHAVPPAGNAFQLLSLYLAITTAGVLKGTVIQEGVDHLWEKLAGAVDPVDRKRLSRMERKIVGIPYAAKQYAAKDDDLDAILRGLVYERRLRIEYQKPTGRPKEYDFEPYTLVAHRGGLYLIGRSVGKEQVVTLAVERMISATVTAEPFDYPIDYTAFGIMPSGKGKTEVEITLRNAATVAYVRPRSLHSTQKLVEHGDGTATLTLSVRGTDELRNWVLAHGPWVEVVRPPKLRDEVRRLLAEALDIYRPAAERGESVSSPGPSRRKAR
ncbi:MAG: WYL domain-containing protein [Acidobacteria bacterium]|nr:WYL domain-containing protein [Acidobacteriota bacterium]